VRGGNPPLQEVGRSEDEGAGAHRGDGVGGLGRGHQVLADGLVAHGSDRAQTAARDQHEVRVGNLVEGLLGQELDRDIAAHRLHSLPDHGHSEARIGAQAVEDLQRPDQVSGVRPGYSTNATVLVPMSVIWTSLWDAAAQSAELGRCPTACPLCYTYLRAPA
jgi:hypothetical protein